jgi:hypothetical protein
MKDEAIEGVGGPIAAQFGLRSALDVVVHRTWSPFPSNFLKVGGRLDPAPAISRSPPQRRNDEASNLRWLRYSSPHLALSDR